MMDHWPGCFNQAHLVSCTMDSTCLKCWLHIQFCTCTYFTWKWCIFYHSITHPCDPADPSTNVHIVFTMNPCCTVSTSRNYYLNSTSFDNNLFSDDFRWLKRKVISSTTIHNIIYTNIIELWLYLLPYWNLLVFEIKVCRILNNTSLR